jgi:transcriptional regulator with XRE-family HTH domain
MARVMERHIGDGIALLRRRTTLTQKQLGTRAGLAKNTIGNYEQGKHEPRASDLVAIVYTLAAEPEFAGVDANDLLLYLTGIIRNGDSDTPGYFFPMDQAA